MNYRPEIDGLRAIAVLPVIFFHAGFSIFKGGYVGVDIFFVISGFLITSILVEELDTGRFSILGFYERRARRILPALFLVLLVCIPFAYSLLLPNQLKDFSQSLIAVSLFVSNILFWQESGYFEPAAEEKPLLHTWSLAVEEQYYIVFPIFLLVFWTTGKPKLSSLLLLVATASLLLCEWGWRNSPSANFYLAPTRAWELLAGSLTAFVVAKFGVQRNNIISWIGFFLIAFAIFGFNKNMPFPSSLGLVPVLGTVLILAFSKGTQIEKILSIKPIVGLGLVSYSAYLWHQPIFAFSKIYFYDEISFHLKIFMCITCLLIAFFSWKIVEKPFRKRNFLTQRSILGLSCCSLIFFCAVGWIGHIQNGFIKRYATDDQHYLEDINDRNAQYVIQRFNAREKLNWDENLKKVLLVGDSYAQDLTNAIYEANLDTKISLVTWHVSARCGNLFVPYVLKEKYIEKRDRARCKSSELYSDQSFRKKIEAADEIWLASSWQPWQLGLVALSLENLKEVKGVKFKLVGRKDFPKFYPRKYLGLSASERSQESGSVSEDMVELNNRLKEIVGVDNFIDVQALMCGGNVKLCKLFDQHGLVKTHDGEHLTRAGAMFYGLALSDVLF